MQMGFNTDIDHLGITVHIQTEDHGLGDSKITTQVFYSGRILDSRTISYAEAISTLDGSDERSAEITKRMRAIHRHFLNRIREGTYDGKLPIDDAVKATPAPAATTHEASTASLSGELAALPDDDILPDEFLDADVDMDRILDFNAKTWRGYDDDFSVALGNALREALPA